jgi:hypothetical protein
MHKDFLPCLHKPVWLIAGEEFLHRLWALFCVPIIFLFILFVAILLFLKLQEDLQHVSNGQGGTQILW